MVSFSPNDFRVEHDLLGECCVPAEAMWGAHTERARDNFQLLNRPVHPALIHAYGLVKLACAQTNADLHYLPSKIVPALLKACEEMSEGALDTHIVVDALQGGAGTSTNMNVNEVLANRSLQLLELPLGQYEKVSPADHVNLHQSTNDTFPTALRVAAIGLLRKLEASLVELQEAFQEQEKQLANVVKLGRTQFQDAVLTTLGREMSAYAEAFARDRWRIYKCEERLRFINLGGTAIGTGLGAPRQFIFAAPEKLRRLTGYGLARAENLVEATQNCDAFVEVSGMLKALATNLLKVCGDLRLLSSGPHGGLAELKLPARQAGSSIMPGKVNPVIPEAATQAALYAIAADTAITHAVSMGTLELNPFLPLVAEQLLGSLSVLQGACTMLSTHCVRGIEARVEACRQHVQGATATATALVAVLGYEVVQTLVLQSEDTGRPLRDLVIEQGHMSASEFDACITPEAVNRLGSPECQGREP